MRFHVDSDCGQIGPFWWSNAVCQKFEVRGFFGTMDNLSLHSAWRQGGFGLEFNGRFRYLCPVKWRIIEALN
jgi:hypothetical protein